METDTSFRPRRNISEIKNKQRRAEAYRQMKREQKKVRYTVMQNNANSAHGCH